MTFSNAAPRNSFALTPRSVSPRAALGAAGSARLWAVVMRGLMWMAAALMRAQSRDGAARLWRSKRFRIVLMGVALVLSLMPGTRAQKEAHLRQVVAKVKARMAALYRRAVIRRQRIRWMWGGGFRNAALSRLCHVFTARRGPSAFAQLIPD